MILPDCGLIEKRNDHLVMGGDYAATHLRSIATPLVVALVACAPDRALRPVSSDVATAMQLVSALDSVPGAYIVQLDESVQDVAAKTEALLGSVGGVRRRTFDRVLKGFSVDSLSPAAVAALRRDPGVRLVEPVRLTYPAVTQVLPFENGAYMYSGLWNLDRVDEFGTPSFNGMFSFDYSGSGSHVYIVDSGVRGGHVEFTGRLGNGAAFIKWSTNPGPTIDAIGHGTAVTSRRCWNDLRRGQGSDDPPGEN